MQPSDKPAFLSQLTGLATIKPGAKLTKEAYEIWWQAMQGWSLEDFKSACSQLARAVEFMPSPYHFEQLRKAGRPTSGEAWAEVLSHVRAGEYQRRGVIVNELVDRAVAAIGGYHAIGMSEVDKTHFLEKRFAEAFEQLQDAEDVREVVPQIAYSGSSNSRLKGPQTAQALLGRLAEQQ